MLRACKTLGGRQASGQLAPSIVVGFAVLGLTPLVSVALAATVLGAPLGLLGLMLWGVVMWTAAPLLALLLGRSLAQWRAKSSTEPSNKVWLAWTAVALLGLAVIGSIPVLGWPVACLATCAAVGAAAKTVKFS